MLPVAQPSPLLLPMLVPKLVPILLLPTLAPTDDVGDGDDDDVDDDKVGIAGAVPNDERMWLLSNALYVDVDDELLRLGRLIELTDVC
jgi:hypothetical protein